MKSAARWLARLVVLAAITAAFTELVLRAQEPFFHLMVRRFDWASRFIGDPIWNHWPRPSRTTTHAMVDPAAYPRPFTYRTNSLGLRDDRELAMPKPRDLVRILVLGDSYTEGYYAEDTVSARLEARLAKLFPDVKHEVINGGCSSYSPLLEYHSSIPPESAQWQKEVAPTIDNLRRIIEFCRNRRIRIAVTTYPHRRHLAPNPGEPLWHRGYERRIQELCDKEHVPFHSAYDDIAAAHRAGQPLYWATDVHFTPVGQRVWSESIINFYLTGLHPAREGW